MKLDCEKQNVDSDRQAQGTIPVARWIQSLLCAGVLGIAIIAAGWIFEGRMIAEKLATSLAMPVGFVWLLLAGRIFHCVLLGRLLHHKVLLFAWLILWVGGTSPLSKYLAHYLETQVTTYDPRRDPPLDTVVVLGGCTSMGPWRAQAGEAGDRIVLAAELFLTGKTKQLVATGEALPGSSKSQSTPSDHAIELWSKLGIPRSAIKTSPGRNTSEEVQGLKAISGELAGPRIGLLTSGIHIPRAVRLARAANLNVVPIAADIKTADTTLRCLDMIPHAQWLNRLSQCQHELMARLLSR